MTAATAPGPAPVPRVMETIERPAVLEQRYGPNHCPIEYAIGTIADKWKLLILIQLTQVDVLRFKALQRVLGTVSQKVLTSALREMESDGLVERTVYPEVPPRVEYRATERARALLPILDQLQGWATRTF